jgi:hypothetical protein
MMRIYTFNIEDCGNDENNDRELSTWDRYEDMKTVQCSGLSENCENSREMQQEKKTS